MFWRCLSFSTFSSFEVVFLILLSICDYQEKFKDLNVFQYGITPGSWEYREQLAKFLTESYGDEVLRCMFIFCLINIL